MSTIFCIVEGHGDVRAVPYLVRRIAEHNQVFSAVIPQPFRLARSKMTEADALSRAVTLGARTVIDNAVGGGIILLADSDDDCAVTECQTILSDMRNSAQGIECRAVFAVREYESWFLGSSSSLAGKDGIVDNPPQVSKLEGIRNAKGYFNTHFLLKDRTYKETVDQQKYTHYINFSAPDAPDSLKKFVRDVTSLL